jgi:hypothetical protein
LCRVGGHPRESVDALLDHGVESALRGVTKQVVDAPIARYRDPECGAISAVAAFGKVLASAR